LDTRTAAFVYFRITLSPRLGSTLRKAESVLSARVAEPPRSAIPPIGPSG